MDYVYIINTIKPFIFLSVIILFPFLIIWPGRKKHYEKDLEELFQSRCSAYIFPYNHTWPFVRISIYSNDIVIRSIKQYRIKMKNIFRIERVSGSLSNGFKVLIHQSDIPQSITVWVNDSDRVIDIISSYIKPDEFED